MVRVLCACSLALLAYVVARAPLWNPVMAGARAHVGAELVPLVSTAWRCSERPHVCSTSLDGEPLVARVGTIGFDPIITCTATFRGEAVPCETRLWYAPQLKPFLEIGPLSDVRFHAAMWERPWRWLDRGLLGEEGPLPFYAGCWCALMLALVAASFIQRRGLWWLARIVTAALIFVALNVAWFFQCLALGYVD